MAEKTLSVWIFIEMGGKEYKTVVRYLEQQWGVSTRLYQWLTLDTYTVTEIAIT